MPSQEATTPTSPSSNTSMHVNRRLKSFGPPDLEVVVGKDQRLYRYHSFILASYSSYIDTMLSSPMVESKTKHISFPDIEPDVWERMIEVLEPGGIRGKVFGAKDLLVLTPIFDKYQFEDGMRLCNQIIDQTFTNLTKKYLYSDSLEYDPLAAMAFELDLPMKSKAVDYARLCLTKYLHWLSEEQLVRLLPLIENEKDVLLQMGKMLLGRNANDLTVDELRQLTKNDDFVKICMTRRAQIKEINAVLDIVRVDEFRLFSANCFSIQGEYAKRGKHGEESGALKCRYFLKHSKHDVRVEAVDIFGNAWEIAIWERADKDESEYSDEEEESEEVERVRRVLYRWDGGYSSLVPPMVGWKPIVNGTETSPDGMNLTYKINDDGSCF